VWHEVEDYLVITFGLVLYALGWTAFLLPYEIASGGLTGISAIVYYITGLEMQYTYFTVNALLILAAIKGEEQLNGGIPDSMMGVYFKQIVDTIKAYLPDAKIVADSIAQQIENRASFRMAQKKAIRNVMKAGAKGVKTLVSGRLNGADIARSEGYSEGTIPLHTLRADVDYALSEADTTFGKIGVKVWIYKGEILGDNKKVEKAEKAEKTEKTEKREKAKGGN
jgi:hypothetical protein